MNLTVTVIPCALLTFFSSGIAFGESFPKADDWHRWRGPEQTGVAPAGQSLPMKWGDSENVLWKAPVPGRGHGTPIVVGTQVVLATADERKEVQSVLCYDRASGKRLWQTVVHRGGFMKRNKKASQASGSLACDGERFFINFANGGGAHATALSRDGKILWQTKVTEEGADKLRKALPDLNVNTGADLATLVNLAASAPVKKVDLKWIPASTVSPPRSGNGKNISIHFENKSGKKVKLYWVGFDGNHQLYAEIANGATRRQNSYGNHTWLITDEKDNALGHFICASSEGRAVIPAIK